MKKYPLIPRNTREWWIKPFIISDHPNDLKNLSINDYNNTLNSKKNSLNLSRDAGTSKEN